MISYKQVLSACAALAFASLASAWGQTGGQVITAVEEDWQLVVAQPDIPGIGPQITTCMRPGGDSTAPFVAFDMNYREYPTFQAGGMQIQVWSNNQVLATSGQGSAQFETQNETITWTQRMSNNNGVISYGVSNGQSTTFGKFGQGQGLLSVGYSSTKFSDMSGYNSATSVASSGVSWEPNLAGSLALVQVRYYSNGQLVATDTNTYTVNLGN